MRRSVEQKVRDQLHETGQRGVRQLARIFDVEDYDGLGKELSFDEMRNKLRACQVELTHNEFKVLYGWCDKNQDGMVTVGHFIAGIRPPLKPDRFAIVQRAFDIINRTHPGVLTLDDMQQAYYVERHAKYRNGHWPRERVLATVLSELMLGTERQDCMTKEEFFDYYAMQSANIEKDVYFDFLLRTTWKL